MEKDDRLINFDDFMPAEMAKRVEAASIRKANLNFLSLLALAVLAGAFIAFGAEFYTIVTFDSNLSVGLTRFIGGICFSVGLILVIVAGAELFTGNNLIIMGVASRTVTFKQLFKNWGVSYFGNFAGAVIIVLVMYFTNQWKLKDALLGANAVMIAATKVNLTFLEGFTRGMLCNALVCLAVWLSFSARTVVSKISAVILPITAFVASGFEHSIANMYFIPYGMMLKNNPKVLVALEKLSPNIDLSHLNFLGLFGNLLSVTIGNIVGGTFVVGLVYWFIIVRPQRIKLKNKEEGD
jgi:formate/nitrite transporter